MPGAPLDLFAWTSLKLASSLVSLSWKQLIEEKGDEAFASLDPTSLAWGRNILVKAREKTSGTEEVWDRNEVENFLEERRSNAQQQVRADHLNLEP